MQNNFIIAVTMVNITRINITMVLINSTPTLKITHFVLEHFLHLILHTSHLKDHIIFHWLISSFYDNLIPSVIIIPTCQLWRQFDERLKKPFPDDQVSSQQSLPGGSSPVGCLLFMWDLGFEVRYITTTIIINMLMTRIMKDCNHQHNYLHLVGFYLAGNHFVPPEI